jgi:hypothetical protein
MIPYDPFIAIIFVWLRILAWPIAIYFSMFFLLGIIRMAVWKNLKINWKYAFVFVLASAAWCWLITGWTLS